MHGILFAKYNKVDIEAHLMDTKYKIFYSIY